MSNSIYNNNANVEFGSTPVSARQELLSGSPDGAVDQMTSIYDSIVYLGKSVSSSACFYFLFFCLSTTLANL